MSTLSSHDLNASLFPEILHDTITDNLQGRTFHCQECDEEHSIGVVQAWVAVVLTQDEDGASTTHTFNGDATGRPLPEPFRKGLAMELMQEGSPVE